MPLHRLLASGALRSLLVIVLSQSAPQSTTQKSGPPPNQLTQDELCCLSIDFVEPSYPREARLAHIEGEVKLILVIGVDGSVADLKAISGPPFLVESTMKALRQWHFSGMPRVVGEAPRETEVPVTFTFKIETPKPAYLHLKNGKVIRADDVHEFTNEIEYSVDRRAHHLSPGLVTEINACANTVGGLVFRVDLKEGDCVPQGGPSYVIRTIPLLPVVKGNPASR